MVHYRILFIVNPISGFGLGWEIPYRIRRIAAYKHIEYNIRFTEYAGHAKEIVEQAKQQNYTHIIAAGGDGTVNEIGTALINTGIAFGVISLGSGNGFARHLGFSQMMNKALKQVLKSETTNIDVVEINGHYSLNVSGFGFDAEVAHFFSTMKIRGIFSYIYSIVHMWFRYPGKRYVFHINGKTWEEDCFVLSVANSSQYGNNASIAPKASLRDGLVDVCILKRPKYYQIPRFLYCFMNSKIARLPYFSEIQCEEAILEGDLNKAHIDGDPYTLESPVKVKVLPGVLKVIAPKLSRKKKSRTV
ncbi:diacylglycerol/lipid kinase family protein [Butyricimonas faecalis]|uniref:Diacylglycerol kinase family lipid kinase n=1 Tax=Butyricimonas faecalis TaxID=2093856 RepID=A0A3Q9ITC4_9BACT|nr:diacylglycerol kinase family protein [Butyricimonas faecalis]AZS31564.1 diacylglycerol kinase family lipid kinase [Butyricimonas faecalis]MBS7155623.1 diacylglycerol kinase family lipid kinase [Sanguibacteroides justesenii]